MERRMPRPGDIYDHFKDKPYQIITIATDTETDRPMVVYQALYGDFKTYVRSLDMFMSEVDHEKYPEVKKNYRFELREEHSVKKEASSPRKEEASFQRKEEVSFQRKEEASFLGKNCEENVLTPCSFTPFEMPQSNPVVPKNTDGEVNLLLMKFLDAESYSKKLEILTSNRRHLNDRLITDMAVALDLAVDEGPLDQRINGLINCLQAMRRFEDRRLR